MKPALTAEEWTKALSRPPGVILSGEGTADRHSIAAICLHGRIEEGDILLLRNPNSPDGKSAYRVESIKYFSDPPDMWSARLVFAPRTHPNPAQ